MLRLLVLGTVLVPVLLGVVAAYFSYRAADERAAAALSEADAVAVENTNKVLDTHLLVAARIDDLLAGLTDAQVRAAEKSIHDRIAQQIGELPQIAAAWVIGADGRELVSARVFPVNRDLDLSTREDFRALKASGAPAFVWALRARNLDNAAYEAFFTVSRPRRPDDGQFHGIIVVAVSGQYFGSFYSSLLDSSAQYEASVIREDGSVLARYPATAAGPATEPAPALLKAMAGKTRSGIIESGSPIGDDGRVLAYRRLADYPIYVTVGRTRAAIFQEWLGSLIGYAVVGVPVAVSLMLLAVIALRRTRREQLALAQARDEIARRAAVETRLNQAQRLEAVGLLTAGIAHDFNNLLTVISGNMMLLHTAGSALDAKARQYITSAITGCERAAELTKRLLGFARQEPADPQRVDVNEVATAVLALPWRSGDRISTDFRLASDLWPVFVDPGQLGDALINIALNARDAMDGGGTLTIETATCSIGIADMRKAGMNPGDYVTISISDTGSGIPPDVLKKIFDPFFTTKEAGKGSGLGLAQVQGFITRSRGHCRIDSEPGRGTTITLYLPRYRCTADEEDADDTVDVADSLNRPGRGF